MIRKLIKSGQRGEQRERELLALAVADLEEIAERLIGRIEKKLKELKDAERSAEERIGKLAALLERLENLNIPADLGIDPRYREISNLVRKGLKVDEIARILDVPRGEVELIMNINK